VEDTEQRAAPVRFGPGPTQELHPDTASKMLTILKEEQPSMFGKVLCKALGIEMNGRRN
jgi:hypothetical protein